MGLGGGVLLGSKQDANQSFIFFTLVQSIRFGLGDDTLTELSLLFYRRVTCYYACLLGSNIVSMLY